VGAWRQAHQRLTAPPLIRLAAGAGPYLLSVKADATLVQQNGQCSVIWTNK
jgi:hypothetical protein